jgi:hypothetical protein
MLQVSKLIESLSELSPLQLQATRLLHQLTQLNSTNGLSVEKVMQIGPQIDQALVEAERVSEQSREVLERCQKLKPKSTGIPQGF